MAATSNVAVPPCRMPRGIAVFGGPCIESIAAMGRSYRGLALRMRSTSATQNASGKRASTGTL